MGETSLIKNLTIRIIPTDNQSKLVYDDVSSPSKIQVLRTDSNSFSVLYYDSDLESVRVYTFVDELTKLLLINLRGSEINITIEVGEGQILVESIKYIMAMNMAIVSWIGNNCQNVNTLNMYEVSGEHDGTKFNFKTGQSVLDLYSKMYSVPDEMEPLRGAKKQAADELVDSVQSNLQDLRDEVRLMRNLIPGSSVEDEEDPDEYYINLGNSGDDEDDEFENLFANDPLLGSPKKKKKSSKKNSHRFNMTYPTSRIIKATDNPKKNYKQHGVMVCSKKSAIEKDEETIKDFLKDFIPGKEDWKKKLRKDLLERWMSTYVVTKKKLKKLEKGYKRDVKHASRPKIDVNKTLNFTRQLLSTPIDNWNNPNK